MRDPKDVRVLLVDDDYLAGEMIRAVLNEIGYTVVGRAMDGCQAIKMVSQLAGTSTQPDVILMDIEMPGMDGIETTRLMQECCPVPVVVLTAYETDVLVAEASDVGAGAYLVKPAQAGEMKRAITIALARFDDMVALSESNRRLEETLAELKVTQERVVKQERLAAVGRLAAGIAHEFNNIMSSVILYSDIMLNSANLSLTDRERLAIIRQQGHHAADLTQQILDFGRKAVLRRQDLDLASFLCDLEAQLVRTMPESIHVRLDGCAGQVMVNVDLERLQQAIVNLAHNARDAMLSRGGGVLHIELALVHMAEDQASLSFSLDHEHEMWARIKVSDTGTGIPPEVLPHIYEPFFTTRAPLGRGLGLAQVYGIVKQHQGHIDTSTQVNVGTTFTIYLPALPMAQTEPLFEAQDELPAGNGEIILLVENDAIVQQALAECLEILNYRALLVFSGREALALLEQYRDQDEQITLVLCDQTLPEMADMMLCRAFKKRAPGVGVVVLANYPREDKSETLAALGVVGWLQKPASLDQLAQTLAQALKPI